MEDNSKPTNLYGGARKNKEKVPAEKKIRKNKNAEKVVEKKEPVTPVINDEQVIQDAVVLETKIKGQVVDTQQPVVDEKTNAAVIETEQHFFPPLDGEEFHDKINESISDSNLETKPAENNTPVEKVADKKPVDKKEPVKKQPSEKKLEKKQAQVETKQETPAVEIPSEIKEVVPQSPVTENKKERFKITHLETVSCFDVDSIIGYNIFVGLDYAKTYGKNAFVITDDSDVFQLAKFKNQNVEILPYMGLRMAKEGSVVCVDNKGKTYSEIIRYMCENMQDCLLMFSGLNIKKDDIDIILKKSKDGSGVDISANVGVMTNMNKKLVNRSTILRFMHDPMFMQSSNYLDKFLRNTNSPEMLFQVFVSQHIFETRYDSNKWNEGDDEFTQLIRMSNPVYFVPEEDGGYITGCTYDEFKVSTQVFIDMMKPMLEMSGEQVPTMEDLALSWLSDNILPKELIDYRNKLIQQSRQAQKEQKPVEEKPIEQKKPEPNKEQNVIDVEKQREMAQDIIETFLGEKLDDETPEEKESVVENENTQEVEDADQIIFNVGEFVSSEQLQYPVEDGEPLVIGAYSTCEVVGVSDVYGLLITTHPEGLTIDELTPTFETIAAADKDFSDHCMSLDNSKKYILAPFDSFRKNG